jgi:hypothetical protein
MPGGWLRDRGTFHRTGRAGRPLGSPSRRAAPAGRPAQLPRVFIGVRRHRLDLSSRRFRGTTRGRARPYDFCRWMSPRARPRTTRTSRSAQCAVATAAWARPAVSFRSKQPLELLEVRGRANRCPTFPAAIARAGDFAPTPIAPGTSCRETPSLAGLERRGEVVALPASFALARGARRQGGVAPGIREEARC